MDAEERGGQLVREFDRLAADRSTWEGHWEEIAAVMLPAHKGTFTGARTAGDKRHQQVVDSTPVRALKQFAAILDSLLTPRNQTWHKLMSGVPELNRVPRVRRWFDEATRVMFQARYSPTANFASQNQQGFVGLGAYGTSAMYTDALRGPRGDRGVRYRNVHLREIYFGEDFQGRIDTAYRCFELDARQVRQQWPGEELPAKLRERIEEADKAPSGESSSRKMKFLHCVFPRRDADPDRMDGRGKPFASWYVCRDTREAFGEGGYDSFPFAIARHEQGPGELYGRSPGMDALPEVKTLNEMRRTLIKQAHRAVDPVLFTHDDGVVDVSLRPGSINPGGVSADGRPLVWPMPSGAIHIGHDMLEASRASIRSIFLVDLFQILVETPQMTATEVLERVREKGFLLTPVLGGLQSEYLGPLIGRELWLLSELGMLPPMPQEILEAGAQFRIQYDSPLSRLQRSEEAAGIWRAVERALEVATTAQQPEVLDHFDFDVIIPETAIEVHGVPARWMRTLDDVQALRADRAQGAAAEQEIRAAPGAAALVKAASVAAGAGGPTGKLGKAA